MPAGTDLVTWNPRVGDTGDDRYDPGDSLLRVGPSDIYSDPPTLTQVNQGAGMNQIYAELNRRLPYSPDYIARSTRSAVIPYMAADKRLKADDLEAGTYPLRTTVNSLRGIEFSGAFTFTDVYPLLNRKAFRQYLLEIRKALATDCYTAFLRNGYVPASPLPSVSYMQRTGTTYPPGTTSLAGTFGPSFDLYSVGSVERTKISSTSWRIARVPLFYQLASDLPAIANAAIHFSYEKGVANADATPTIGFYRANSYFAPLDTGDWNNDDVLEAVALENTLHAGVETIGRNSLALDPALCVASAQLAFIVRGGLEGTEPTGNNLGKLTVKGGIAEPGTWQQGYEANIGECFIRMYTS